MCWSIFEELSKRYCDTGNCGNRTNVAAYRRANAADRMNGTMTGSMLRRLPLGPSRAAVPPFAVMSILNRVAQLRAQGREVISLCAGEPSQGCTGGRPETGRRADGRPYAAGLHGNLWDQTVAARDRRTLPALVLLDTRSDSRVDHRLIWRLLLGFLAAFDQGDRGVDLAGYPAYRNILASLGCQVVELACGPAQRFQPSVEMLSKPTRLRPWRVWSSPLQPIPPEPSLAIILPNSQPGVVIMKSGW